MTDEHICDASTNPCACGRGWEYSRTYSNGAIVYTSKSVRDRYLALYGASNEAPFKKEK